MLISLGVEITGPSTLDRMSSGNHLVQRQGSVRSKATWTRRNQGGGSFSDPLTSGASATSAGGSFSMPKVPCWAGWGRGGAGLGWAVFSLIARAAHAV